jgi:hypothetical protein
MRALVNTAAALLETDRSTHRFSPRRDYRKAKFPQLVRCACSAIGPHGNSLSCYDLAAASQEEIQNGFIAT